MMLRRTMLGVCLLALAALAPGCGPLVGVRATIGVDRRTQLEREVLGQRANLPPQDALLSPAEHSAADPEELEALLQEYVALEERLADLERKDSLVRAWQVVALHNRGVLRAWLGEPTEAAELLRQARDSASAWWLGTLEWQSAADLALLTGDDDALAEAAELLLDAPLLTDLDYRFESPERRADTYAALIGAALDAGDAEAALRYALEAEAVELARTMPPGALRVPPGELHDALERLEAARRDLARRREARCALPLQSLSPGDRDGFGALEEARLALAFEHAAGGLFVPAPADALEVQELLTPGTALLAFAPAGDGGYAGFLLGPETFEVRGPARPLCRRPGGCGPPLPGPAGGVERARLGRARRTVPACLPRRGG